MGNYIFIHPLIKKIINLLHIETFAQKPSSKNAIKLATSQRELQSITGY